MKEKLEKFLKSKKVFKLVCGAGNEYAQDVERLVYLYSKAGAQIFDISANLEILKAAKKGLKLAGHENDKYICVSFGIKGDPHVLKATINKDKCQNCKRCEILCENNAIKNSQVIKERCLGCCKCNKICPASAISMLNIEKNIETVLPPLVTEGIDCVELHATAENGSEIAKKWKEINNNFDGILSICIDRLWLGNKKVIERIKNMIDNRKDFSTIIQADGIPMSGSDDKYKTTLQAVAMAEIIQDENLPVHILISGGTNSKTVKLAKLCDIEFSGVAIGSYARKIVKEYIEREDFYKNKYVQEEALSIAKTLVNTVTI